MDAIGFVVKGFIRQEFREKISLLFDDFVKASISIRFSDEDIWLTQGQIAELYYTTQQNISQHIESIHKDRKLERD